MGERFQCQTNFCRVDKKILNDVYSFVPHKETWGTDSVGGIVSLIIGDICGIGGNFSSSILEYVSGMCTSAFSNKVVFPPTFSITIAIIYICSNIVSTPNLDSPVFRLRPDVIDILVSFGYSMLKDNDTM